MTDAAGAGWSDTQADCRRLFEENSQPMWITDAQAIVEVNAATVIHYGYTRAELLTMTVEDLELIERTGETRQGSHPGRHRKKDGSVVDVDVTSFAITFAGRSAWLVSVLDVTYRTRAEETIRALLRDVITAQEEERRRIARELHDETAQALTSLLVGLRTAEESQELGQARGAVGKLRVVVAATLEGVQRISRGLRPSVLDDLGLEQALERLASETTRARGFVVDLHVTGPRLPRLPESLEIALYRVAQEALTNAGKHAAPKAVSVLIHRHPHVIRLVIEDDGRGFDVGKAHSDKQLGLLGMRERAHLVGGSLTVESSPGGGTTVCVSVPLVSL